MDNNTTNIASPLDSTGASIGFSNAKLLAVCQLDWIQVDSKVDMTDRLDDSGISYHVPVKEGVDYIQVGVTQEDFSYTPKSKNKFLSSAPQLYSAALIVKHSVNAAEYENGIHVQTIETSDFTGYWTVSVIKNQILAGSDRYISDDTELSDHIDNVLSVFVEESITVEEIYFSGDSSLLGETSVNVTLERLISTISLKSIKECKLLQYGNETKTTLFLLLGVILVISLLSGGYWYVGVLEEQEKFEKLQQQANQIALTNIDKYKNKPVGTTTKKLIEDVFKKYPVIAGDWMISSIACNFTQKNCFISYRANKRASVFEISEALNKKPEQLNYDLKGTSVSIVESLVIANVNQNMNGLPIYKIIENCKKISISGSDCKVEAVKKLSVPNLHLASPVYQQQLNAFKIAPFSINANNFSVLNNLLYLDKSFRMNTVSIEFVSNSTSNSVSAKYKITGDVHISQ